MNARVLAAALAATMMAAGGAAAGDKGYEVLRAGDRDLSCEALTSEINQLNADVAAAAQKAERGKKAKSIFGSLATGAMQSASSYGLGGSLTKNNPLLGQVAVQAANSAVQTAQRQSAENPAPAQTGASPQQQRLDHLNGLYGEKGC